MYAPQNAAGLGVKNAGIPPTSVDHSNHVSENPVQAGMNGHALGRNLFQNSSSLVRRSGGSLPAMMLALIAPIEVPTPIGLDPCFMQRLIYTNLVGSQGSAALKDEYHLSVCLSAEFIDGCLNHSFGHVTHRSLRRQLLAASCAGSGGRA